MTSPNQFSNTPILLCRICNRPVPIESAETDSDGKAVHGECYVHEINSSTRMCTALNECRPVRILLADDVSEWRARVREILRGRPDWQIIGEACDGIEAIQKASELRPDLVLLDIGMPVMNGLHAAAKIREAVHVPKIVFLTQDNDPDLRSAALTIATDGYVLKSNARTELVSALDTALRNGHRPNSI